MPDVKEVINGLEMSYKYSNVDENNTLVPQWIVFHAIALLKAQESRVMTMEDIRESIEHDKRISVYLQQKDGICREPRPALYTNLYGEGIDLRLGVDYVDYGGWLEQRVLYTKEYLKTWCLWTSRPDDKRRAETPWND